MLREQLPSEPAPVVLIVEDDVLLRLTIAGSLRDAGFEVLEAANAAEAVQILNCIPVDALFSDIDMPGRMDGCALAQWVHQRELNVRIILTSGPDRALGEAGEYVSYLSKPYASDEVEHLLEAFFPRYRRRKRVLSRRQFRMRSPAGRWSKDKAAPSIARSGPVDVLAPPLPAGPAGSRPQSCSKAPIISASR